MICVMGFCHCRYRAKQFVTERCHVRRHVRDNGRVIKIAFVFSASQQARVRVRFKVHE